MTLRFRSSGRDRWNCSAIFRKRPDLVAELGRTAQAFGSCVTERVRRLEDRASNTGLQT